MAALTDFLFIGLLLQQCQGKLAHASQIQSTAIFKKKKKSQRGSCQLKKIYTANLVK